MSVWSEEQLRPSYPPKLPFRAYPMRCHQCLAIVDKFGPLTSSVGNKIFRLVCKNKHEWIEVST